MGFNEFQYNTPEGGINVQIHVEFENDVPQFRYIIVHSSFGTGLPSFPQLRVHNGEQVFYVEYDIFRNDKLERVYEYINNDLTRALIERINVLVEEERKKEAEKKK